VLLPRPHSPAASPEYLQRISRPMRSPGGRYTTTASAAPGRRAAHGPGAAAVWKFAV